MFYHQQNRKPEPAVAGALCSAILSDTLAFRSPTCTAQDKETAQKLAALAGIIDIEAYAKDMFVAGSELGNKTEKEILYLDFKKFTSGGKILWCWSGNLYERRRTAGIKTKNAEVYAGKFCGTRRRYVIFDVDRYYGRIYRFDLLRRRC